MKDGLLAKLDALQKTPPIWGNTEKDVVKWEEEIRIMLELKKLGCRTVFDGLNIDEQIQERQHLLLTIKHHQTGEM